jgi:apolipoprotein N-acyltransferase
MGVAVFQSRTWFIAIFYSPYYYDKFHLVPFGEFIPPGFQWFVNAFRIPMSDFARGNLMQAPFQIERSGQDSIGAAITICYEDIFGNELASRIRNSEAPVNLFVNITNLAWFGQSQAPSQQLRLSQMRSIETGLPSIRSTNTGSPRSLVRMDACCRPCRNGPKQA